MAFFLIGKGPDEGVRLLSPSLFPSRQEAMAELSRLTAEPSFDDWDADVVVMDLDTGAPVLLVRPQAAPTPSVEETEAEGGADAWLADLPPAALATTEEGAVEVADAQTDAVERPEPSTESAEPQPDIEAISEEPAPAELSEAAGEPVLDDAHAAFAAAENDDLRDAILRTTQHMSAEGIAAPPSAGLSWAPVAIGEALAASGVGTGAEEVAEPAATTPPPVEAADENAAAGAPAEDSPSAWPWAGAENGPAQPAADASEVYEALAEPIVPVTSADAEALPPHDLIEDTASDFILDLDSVEPVSAAEPEGAGGEPDADDSVVQEAAPAELGTRLGGESSPLTEYTCDDCVYVATCPNRDHRLPKDCGSFQWK